MIVVRKKYDNYIAFFIYHEQIKEGGGIINNKKKIAKISLALSIGSLLSNFFAY